MSLRDNPETNRKVLQLVRARAQEDYAQANDILRDLTSAKDPDDAFLLLLMLGRYAAHIAHRAHHDFNADIMPFTEDADQADTVALQFIALLANDDLPMAADLAGATVAIGNTQPAHTQSVIVALVEFCAQGGPNIFVGRPSPLHGQNAHLN